MKIELTELRELCEKLINPQLERGIETIHLEVDYYWNIPAARRYDPYQKTFEFDLGQLSDDWVELR